MLFQKYKERHEEYSPLSNFLSQHKLGIKFSSDLKRKCFTTKCARYMAKALLLLIHIRNLLT